MLYISNFCPNCGGKVDEDQYYCIECGKPLKENMDQPKIIQSFMNNDQDKDIRIIQEENEIKNDLEKAKQFKESGDYESALSYYSMFLSFNPDNSDAWQEKGFVLSLLGRYKEAIKCFDKALELNPKIPQLILINKGNSLINLGNNKEAILCFNSALKYVMVRSSPVSRSMRGSHPSSILPARVISGCR